MKYSYHADIEICENCLCQVVAVHYNLVKPRSADVNENLLSEVARNQFGLTEDQIKNGQPLEHVIEEVIIN